MAIYCISHKPVTIPETSYFRIIQVGDSSERFASLRDNTGDNIADKNATFSELTAFYYLWKNQRSDTIGFAHYRRYLVPPGLIGADESSGLKPYISSETEGDGKGNYASGNVLNRRALMDILNSRKDLDSCYETLLGSADIVVPRRNTLPEGDMIYQYTTSHPSSSIFALLQVLSDRNHYLGKAAYEYFRQAGFAYWNNLFITRWAVFDSYCEFLFEILFELESRLNLPVCQYQRRVFAFLSERLLNFWIWFKNLSVVETDWCLVKEETDIQPETHQSNPVFQNSYNANWRVRRDELVYW